MMSEYSEAAVEVLDILDHTNLKDVAKIPHKFIKFLVDIASDDYVVNLDHSKPIYELNIKEQTKEILGVIYINWWSNDIEKAKYKRQIIELEEIREKTLREKYNPDTIFEKQSNDEKIEKIQDEVMQENNSLIIGLL